MAVDQNLATIQEFLSVARFYRGTSSETVLAKGSFEPGVMNDATQNALKNLENLALESGYSTVENYIRVELLPEDLVSDPKVTAKHVEAWAGLGRAPIKGGAAQSGVSGAVAAGSSGHNGGSHNFPGVKTDDAEGYDDNRAALQEIMLRDLGVYSGKVDGIDSTGFQGAMAKIAEIVQALFGGNLDNYLNEDAGAYAGAFKERYTAYSAEHGDVLQTNGTPAADSVDAQTMALNGEAGGRDVIAKGGANNPTDAFNMAAFAPDPARAAAFERDLAMRSER